MDQCAVVGSIERKRKEKSAPKLYDLTTLQREANRYYGFTASQTLKIVQELYDEKLVTYPRTDSQYITEDMQQTMTDLFKHYGGETDGVKQVVNNKKVTDHHAILPTLESCKRGSNSLSRDKEKVFALIVWKMQQAVQPPYIYEDVLVTVCCQDRKFTAKYKNVLQAGHTAMPVPFAEQEKAKVEARRAEKIRNYQNQISSLNNQMDDLNMEILKLQKEIERLQNYEADRKRVWEQFQTEHQERQQKLQWVQNMISRCLSAERYHEGMQEDVNGALMCQAISSGRGNF